MSGSSGRASLFDLAQRTGFDIESFIFCFAIGGITQVWNLADLSGVLIAGIPSRSSRSGSPSACTGRVFTSISPGAR